MMLNACHNQLLSNHSEMLQNCITNSLLQVATKTYILHETISNVTMTRSESISYLFLTLEVWSNFRGGQSMYTYCTRCSLLSYANFCACSQSALLPKYIYCSDCLLPALLVLYSCITLIVHCLPYRLGILTVLIVRCQFYYLLILLHR